MTTPRQFSNPKLRWLLLLWLLVGSVWAVSGWLLSSFEHRGTFGDMFGAVNALFTGLAFATLIYTAWMQRDELALQRDELFLTRAELSGQKAQLEEQTKTFQLQRFEDSFFALLRVHSDIVNAMGLVDDRDRVTKSRACFRVWYTRLVEVHSKLGVYPDGEDLQSTQKVYADFYTRHQHELGHYFRHFYHIIKFVDAAEITDKKKYTSLVRAQLSAHEHVLLFYNGLSTFGFKKFKPLIERYELLENMPQDLLLTGARQYALYPPAAYGEDAV